MELRHIWREQQLPAPFGRDRSPSEPTVTFIYHLVDGIVRIAVSSVPGKRRGSAA